MGRLKRSLWHGLRLGGGIASIALGFGVILDWVPQFQAQGVLTLTLAGFVAGFAGGFLAGIITGPSTRDPLQRN
jgi:hypothetical protein